MHLGSTPATAAQPEFDAASLCSMMGVQLKFWVNQANTTAGRKVLTKSGRVDDLWQHLTAHYGLDLTAAPAAAAVAAPASGVLLTLDIQNCQWNALCDPGEEWEECTCVNWPFLLCMPSPGECELHVGQEGQKLTVYCYESSSFIPRDNWNPDPNPRISKLGS